MKLKNKIFYSFVKRFYEKVSEIDDEEIYYKDNSIVVVVKNDELGEAIYDIVKKLKSEKEIISTRKVTFKISKYFIDKYNRVQMFCIDLKKEEDSFSKLEKLIEFVCFVNDMQNKGYILDNSKFENEKADCISSCLSFFAVNSKDVEIPQECIIKYIHYILSDGGDLQEFYTRILSENVFCKVSEFPYSLPIISMCYNYFVSGIVPENIYDVLIREKIEESLRYYYSYIIAISKNIKSNLSIIEDNEEYTIYEGNVKIFHNVSSEFEEFLKNTKIEKTLERIDTEIIDFNGKIIGYKFFMYEAKLGNTILNKKFKNQYEIFEFISEMSNYLLEINRLDCRFSKVANNFNIKKALIYLNDFSNDFKIIEIKDLFYLISTDLNILKKQITTIFFELYLIYFEHIYGEIDNEEQFLEKVEVRYLSPIIAKEFINYALKNKVCYETAIEECFKFINDTRMLSTKGYIYDSRFEYNPLETPFIFDYEAEKKYGIKIKNNMYYNLPDGRKLLTFKRKQKISKLKKQEDFLRKEFLEKIGNIKDKHIKLVKISEIIYSKDINKNNMYKLVGYVTEPIKGKLLTDEVLLNLSNKDFLKVAGYLFNIFNYYYIPLETIWMDDDFVFYINVLDKDFKICKTPNNNDNDFSYFDENLKNTNNRFFNWIINYLVREKGYNPNCFLDWDFDAIYYSGSNQVLIDLADSYDTYCNEHSIYYSSKNKLCPVCLKLKYFIPQNFEETSSKLFEDRYAIHYIIDENCYLKVYKADYVEIAEVEKTVDSIISRKLHFKELNLGQKCFIPHKKAINSNNQFIGYIYEYTSFNTESIDIKDSDLKNLPRLMSLIRLILQVKEITQRKWGFIKNPFSHVYLNKNHKKQVQILNIEYLSEIGSIEDTLRWTYDYVCEIIAYDGSIELDISECSMDLDLLLDELQKLSKEMTKHCSIHKMYYKNSNIFCPKCINKFQLKSIELEYVDPYTITKQKDIEEGGESTIYPFGDKLVAKVFKEKEIDYDFKNLVIYKLLGRKEILEGINKQKLKYKYVIPKKFLVDKESNNTYGYIMKKVDGNPISILKDKVEVEKLGITMKDVFEILITVGEGIKTLHANNIYIGDLNGRNILFDSKKNVYFLDFDGMGIDDIAPVFFTEGYIDPLSSKNKNITMKDDWYSFAVQAFYYLTFTHPFNGIYSIEEDGKKITLDIPSKMERRISLLGNHGMKAPVIALSWDWMSEELKKEFLNIFEGDSRKSIVPYLISQYQTMYKDEPYKPSKNNIQINSKFIATQINPFSGNVIHVINYYSVVCKKSDEYYVSILVTDGTQYDINLPNCMEINEILLSENEKIAFVIFEKEIIVVDLEANAGIYKEEIFDAKNVVVNENTLYFTGTSKGKNIIFQRDFSIKDEVKKEKISFLPNQETKRFFAKFNSKFIIVKRAQSKDEIYCNSEKFCDINYTTEEPKYNIIYDNFTKLWLVVNSQKEGIIIKTDGSHREFDIPKNINDINIENIYFNKGNIYIPSQDYLYIIKTDDQLTTKEMECHKIMTSNSQLFDINTKGFSVITDNKLYEIRRG